MIRRHKVKPALAPPPDLCLRCVTATPAHPDGHLCRDCLDAIRKPTSGVTWL